MVTSDCFSCHFPVKRRPRTLKYRYRCSQEAKLGFLKIVENELGATHGSFRADGEARLAAIYYPINRAEALRLWREGFFSVTGLKSNTIGVGGAEDGGRSKESDSSSSIKLAAYTKATEATPASVEARVIRDLLRFDQKEKAIEFFLSSLANRKPPLQPMMSSPNRCSFKEISSFQLPHGNPDCSTEDRHRF